ncbi:hypothetical protein K443DRAFT_272078 [Laccaria amethystina LaAM-08-1]|uniref:Uncharacterized protein n=1 Tax=Laccaria amethystina LaAM-08-1 TaxID=1095629 RepID=A0A0C9WL09_9AGAR|nr:hypothetical protein K443DRAFT_272078 [Laccaria amethystina LaAM-08-1]
MSMGTFAGHSGCRATWTSNKSPHGATYICTYAAWACSPRGDLHIIAMYQRKCTSTTDENSNASVLHYAWSEQICNVKTACSTTSCINSCYAITSFFCYDPRQHCDSLNDLDGKPNEGDDLSGPQIGGNTTSWT